jgi:SpoU rRNA methylase family enzyme
MCSPTYLVKIEHQIQLTHISKKRIQHFDEEVYRLEVRQLVIVRVDAGAEEEAGVPAVYDLGHVAELDEVGLVLLIAGRNEAVDLWARSVLRSVGSRPRWCCDPWAYRERGLSYLAL